MIPGLVTVVIPVYNVEAYLDRCVQSVVNQTYKNLEIILVDDGSPDACPSMCDAWAQKDKRIKVVHKKNEGAGYARNTGIEKSSGEYICFFDSDDYVEPTLVEECYCVAVAKQAEIIRFGSIDVAQNGRIIKERIPASPKEVYEGEDIREKLIPRLLSHNAKTGENWNIALTFWGTMISMRLIQKSGWRIVSEREIFSEDYYSMFELYQHTKRVVLVRKAYYYYAVNPNSLSHAHSRQIHQRINQMARKMMDLSEKYECKVQAEICTMYFGFVMGEIKSIVSCTERLTEKWKHLKNVVNDEYLQKVLAGYDYTAENFEKKVLFWSMRRKKTGLCYMLAWARNLKG